MVVITNKQHSCSISLWALSTYSIVQSSLLKILIFWFVFSYFHVMQSPRLSFCFVFCFWSVASLHLSATTSPDMSHWGHILSCSFFSIFPLSLWMTLVKTSAFHPAALTTLNASLSQLVPFLPRPHPLLIYSPSSKCVFCVSLLEALCVSARWPEATQDQWTMAKTIRQGSPLLAVPPWFLFSFSLLSLSFSSFPIICLTLLLLFPIRYSKAKMSLVITSINESQTDKYDFFSSALSRTKTAEFKFKWRLLSFLHKCIRSKYYIHILNKLSELFLLIFATYYPFTDADWKITKLSSGLDDRSFSEVLKKQSIASHIMRVHGKSVYFIFISNPMISL